MMGQYTNENFRGGAKSNTREELIDYIQQSQGKALIYDSGRKKLDISKLRDISDADLERTIKESSAVDVNDVIKRINKFATFMFNKYRGRNMTDKKLIAKAKKYLANYKLKEKDLVIFQILYKQKLQNPHSKIPVSTDNEIAHKLGALDPIQIQSAKLDRLTETDKKHIAKMQHLCDETRHLHKASIMKNSTYIDCSPLVLLSPYDPLHHNVSCHVHPLLVALFLPKIEQLDERMLYTNLAAVVTDRVKGKPIRYRPDLEYYVDLTTDENDIACEDGSIFRDLFQRAVVQESLKKIVTNLRNGRLFECENDKLISAIGQCGVSKADATDVILNRGPAVLLQRLLSIFSYHPVHVATRSLVSALGPSMLPQLGSIKKVSMINVTLPIPEMNEMTREVSLLSGFEQQQFFLENNIVVPKRQEVLHGRGVMIFNVNRKYHNVHRFRSQFETLTALPMRIAGFKKINTHPVEYEEEQVFHGQTYFLRSVVVVETKGTDDNEILGHSAIVIKRNEFSPQGLHLNNKYYYHYNPLNCIYPDVYALQNRDYHSHENHAYSAMRRFHQPITQLPKDDAHVDRLQHSATANHPGNDIEGHQHLIPNYPKHMNAHDMIRTKGVVFIYTNQPSTRGVGLVRRSLVPF
jgi:hypothetical protein